MSKSLVMVSAVVVLGLAALATGCGGGGDESSATTVAGSQTAAFDQAFIDSMVPHHEQAIQMAEEAKSAGLSQPELVGIADAIIANQQGEIDQMLEWREAWYGSSEVDPNGVDALGMSMEEMGMEFSAGDFDGVQDVNAAFAAMMAAHHNGAITMAELAENQAEHQEIKDLAGRIKEAQQQEVEVLLKFAGDIGDMEGMDHSSG